MNRKIARGTDGGSTERRTAADSARPGRGRRTVNAPGTGCAKRTVLGEREPLDGRTGVRDNRYQCPHCYRYLHHATLAASRAHRWVGAAPTTPFERPGTVNSRGLVVQPP